MLYHFELLMAGVILLSVMAIGGVSLWSKRRRERAEDEERAARSRELAEQRPLGAGAAGKGAPGSGAPRPDPGGGGDAGPRAGAPGSGAPRPDPAGE